MNNFAVAGILCSLIVLSLAGMMWQALVAAPSPSPTERNLQNFLDWLAKGAGGALIGMLGCWSGI